jgi:TPP-dependent pyruvate/acetoin dehydrogenase alpha subunit
VLDVYVAARDAVARARAGDGPSLLESVSLRWRGHAGHDPAKYVPKEMLEEYMTKKDPVKRFQELLLKEGVVDDAAVEALDERIKKEFDEGYEFAQQSPLPEAADVTAGVFADDGYWSREPGRAGGSPA